MALAGRTTGVKDAGNQSRQHVFVDDVVDAVVAALDKTALSTAGVFNIGPGRMQSLDEIVVAIREVVPNAKIEIRNDGLAWKHIQGRPSND